MPAPSIKSRPVYSRLQPRHGTLQLMFVDDAGAEAVIDLAQRAPPAFFENAHILHVSRSRQDKERNDRLSTLRPQMMYVGPSIAAAIPRLTQTLATAYMGTQLYLAGTEGLIGQAMKVALDAGLDLNAIQAEHRGSEVRRVQCVHCKGITDEVRTQPFLCAHCGLTLTVRDHYSRRIAAFQGVRVDAEEPGVIPDFREIFT